MRSSEMFMECLRTQHCHSKIVAPSCGFLFSFELCTELFSDLKSIFWKVTIRNNSATLKKVNAIEEMYKQNVEANKVGTANWVEQFTAAMYALQDYYTLVRRCTHSTTKIQDRNL